MAQPKKRVPVPKTQSELTREQIVPYDALKGAVPASSKSKKRESNLT